MADSKIISVDTDDDEVVIQAGVRTQPADEPQEAESAQQEVPAHPQEAEEASAAPDAVKDRDDGYHPTTEEDLKAPVPMARMQRGILIALGVLVVACLVYWFFLR